MAVDAGITVIQLPSSSINSAVVQFSAVNILPLQGEPVPFISTWKT